MSYKIFTLLPIVVLLSACATGIIATDKGAFMASKTSSGGAFGNPQSLLAELYEEANQHCSKSNQAVETTSTTVENGIVMLRTARASLNFRCVAK